MKGLIDFPKEIKNLYHFVDVIILCPKLCGGFCGVIK